MPPGEARRGKRGGQGQGRVRQYAEGRRARAAARRMTALASACAGPRLPRPAPHAPLTTDGGLHLAAPEHGAHGQHRHGGPAAHPVGSRRDHVVRQRVRDLRRGGARSGAGLGGCAGRGREGCVGVLRGPADERWAPASGVPREPRRWSAGRASTAAGPFPRAFAAVRSSSPAPPPRSRRTCCRTLLRMRRSTSPSHTSTLPCGVMALSNGTFSRSRLFMAEMTPSEPKSSDSMASKHLRRCGCAGGRGECTEGARVSTDRA